MFGKSCPPPKDTNIINLLWTYGIESDGTKKVRCVCNVSPKDTVTLAHSFDTCLEQSGARVFWASAALLRILAIRADVSNAFAEAPPPKAPLYVLVNRQFCEWWVANDNDDIPEGWVMPVQLALQDHRESPRQSAKK